MLDLHTHVLPGIDDGPRNLEESILLLQAMAADGVHHVVATPHIYPGVYDNNEASIRAAFDGLRAAIDGLKLPITLSWGAEVRLCHEMLEWLDAGQLVSLGRQADGRYTVLVELPDGLVPVGTDTLLARLVERGVQPLLAHPERNRVLAEHPDRLKPLLEAGCKVQITAASLLGEFGSRAEHASRHMVEQGWVSAVASDAHNLRSRQPRLKAAREWLLAHLGAATADELTEAGPARLCGVGELLSAGHARKPVLREFVAPSAHACATTQRQDAEGHWAPAQPAGSEGVLQEHGLTDWCPQDIPRARTQPHPSGSPVQNPPLPADAASASFLLELDWPANPHAAESLAHGLDASGIDTPARAGPAADLGLLSDLFPLLSEPIPVAEVRGTPEPVADVPPDTELPMPDFASSEWTTGDDLTEEDPSEEWIATVPLPLEEMAPFHGAPLAQEAPQPSTEHVEIHPAPEPVAVSTPVVVKLSVSAETAEPVVLEPKRVVAVSLEDLPALAEPPTQLRGAWPRPAPSPTAGLAAKVKGFRLSAFSDLTEPTRRTK